MKKKSQTKIISVWNKYDFTLYIPGDLTGFNKPYISFNFTNENTGKNERIKKFIKKHKGDIKKINEEAKVIVNDLIYLLQRNWNPITKEYNIEKIDPSSNILNCLEFWLDKRKTAFESKSIGPTTLKKIGF